MIMGQDHCWPSGRYATDCSWWRCRRERSPRAGRGGDVLQQVRGIETSAWLVLEAGDEAARGQHGHRAGQ